MKSRTTHFLFAFILVLAAGITGPNFQVTPEGFSVSLTQAEARRYSSSSYRSSSYRSSSSSMWNRKSSVSSSSSSNYKKSYSSSNKASTPKTTSSASSSGNKYSNQKATTGSSTASKSVNSSFAKGAQAQSSKKVLSDRQKRNFANSDTRPNPTVKATSYASSPIVKSYKPVSSTRYVADRNRYYRDWDAPDYAYRGSSSFGMWDAMFLWMMLDTISDSNAATFYHHQNDPGIMAWKAEAEKAAQDNAELKAKLDALDKKVSGMNGEIDPSFVPSGVPQSAYMAKSVATAPNTTVLNVATGGETGMYFKTCELAKEYGEEFSLPVQCVTSNGSLDNGERLIKGEVHGAFMQADAIAEYAQKSGFRALNLQQTDVYKEVVYLLVNRESGIDDVSDISERGVNVYTLGGGAKTTLKSFARYDSDYVPAYKKAASLPASEDALAVLAKDQNSAAFFVCAPKCGLMERADARFGDKLKLIPVDDWSFNDALDAYGNKIYEFDQLEPRYTNLQDSGVFDDGSIETITVSAVYVQNQDWLKAYDERVDGGQMNFQVSFIEARNNARQLIGQE